MASNVTDLQRKRETFKDSCFLTQLMALSVSIAQQAGNIIKVILLINLYPLLILIYPSLYHF